MTRPCCLYGEEPGAGARPLGCSPRWQRRLPQVWMGEVVEPCSFRVHREYEVPARQVFGTDAAGALCFHAYDYRMLEPRLDDDEGLRAALVYAESLRAWRLCDGRWLVHHRWWPDGDDGELVETLRLAERMPREGLQV